MAYVHARLLLVWLAGGVKQLSRASSATMQESLIPWVLTNQVSHSWSHDHPGMSRPCRWSKAVPVCPHMVQKRACIRLSSWRMTNWASLSMTTKSLPSSSGTLTGTQTSYERALPHSHSRLSPSISPVCLLVLGHANCCYCYPFTVCRVCS